MYVVARDFGFAPNPFHGVCTLATCKPAIRSTAQVGDWIVGMGGSDLKATGRCVFAMQVTRALSFDAYWSDPEYLGKRPVRSGSRKMMIGDNIYHRPSTSSEWLQADSHHSQPDGKIDSHNVKRDTSINRVLISRHFFYFGSKAPFVPDDTLSKIGFQNCIGHRVYRSGECEPLLKWLFEVFANKLNQVSGDPFDFKRSDARYSVKTNRVV